MAPAHPRTIVVDNPESVPLPAPPSSAILTVLAVFSFLSLLILLVAGWIRCVEGMDGRIGGDADSFSDAPRKRKGFDDWYHKRRDTLQRRAATPWRRAADTKFWQDYERPDEMAGLFRKKRKGSAAYNTFDSKWYRSSASEDDSEDDDEDDSDSEVSSSPRTLKVAARPIMQHRSTEGATAGRCFPKRRELVRSNSAPVKKTRRKLGASADDPPARPAKIARKQNARQNWNSGRAKILDVVPEETGTGATPPLRR